jgi:transglutaminase-like putative cysteine protease
MGTLASMISAVLTNMIGQRAEFQKPLYAFKDNLGEIVSNWQEWGEIKFNTDVEGKPIKIGSKSYANGIGTHGNSRILIELPPNASSASGTFGPQVRPQTPGSVVGKIAVDGKTVVFQTKVMKSGDEPVNFNVPVKGIRFLELIVTTGGDNHFNDLASWVDLKLEIDKSRPYVRRPEVPNVKLVRTLRRKARVEVVADVKDFEGRMCLPIPPSDQCQDVVVNRVGAEIDGKWVDAVRSTELTCLKQPIAIIDTKKFLVARATCDMTVSFYDTRLVPGTPPKPQPLSPAEKYVYLQEPARNDPMRWKFREWMTDYDLWRKPGETEIDFAVRVLRFMNSKFKYVIPDAIPAFLELVKKYGVDGDYQYTIQNFTGECWRLSETYNWILMLNGIPCRLISGNWVPSYDHHLRSHIYLEGLGWIPVEATAASGGNPNWLKCFGGWGGDYLSGNSQIHLLIPMQNGGQGWYGTFDRWWIVGSPESNIKYSLTIQ